MNALLLATMVIGAAASDSEELAALRHTEEFKLIEKTMNDIAGRIASINVKMEESDFNWISFEDPEKEALVNGTNINSGDGDEEFTEVPETVVSSYLQNEDVDEDDIFEKFDPKTEDRIIERMPGLKKNPPPSSHLHKKRSCKTFEDTQFKTNAKDRSAVVLGYTWESCLHSCEENLLCAQVIFDKEKKQCYGQRVANSAIKSGDYEPAGFISGHCKTEIEESIEGAKFMRKAVKGDAIDSEDDGVVEDASMLQTDSEVKVDADSEFEEKMKMEEQLGSSQSDVAEPQESAQFWDRKKDKIFGAQFWDHKKDKILKKPEPLLKKPAVAYWSKATSNLKLRQKTKKTKKCTTFETEKLVKKGSLLQMGKKLLASETTGDFLTCLSKCQKDDTCKQVVYDKQASECYKHNEIVVQKTNAKGTKYIAATCV